MVVKTDLWLVLLSFVLALLCGFIFVPLLRRLKAGQSILRYVELHATKSGTPTMGGLIFIVPIIGVAVVLVDWQTPLSIMLLVASLGYGLVGFLDDFLKIKHHQNLGLRAYQKIIGQLGIALLVAWFYTRSNPTGEIWVPFVNCFWQIGGVGIFALTLLILVATTNAVNLTDGLDGLAGSTSLIYFLFLYALLLLTDWGDEVVTLGHIVAITVGSLAAYLLFNTKKASVFMGDTGSLFLGGLVAMASLFAGMGLVIVVLGIMFVWSALSTMLQVAYFKITKGKRIFRMAPFHHHLEQKGWQEPKIVALYVTVTALMGVALVLSLMYA